MLTPSFFDMLVKSTWYRCGALLNFSAIVFCLLGICDSGEQDPAPSASLDGDDVGEACGGEEDGDSTLNSDKVG